MIDKSDTYYSIMAQTESLLSKLFECNFSYENVLLHSLVAKAVPGTDVTNSRPAVLYVMCLYTDTIITCHLVTGLII